MDNKLSQIFALKKTFPTILQWRNYAVGNFCQRYQLQFVSLEIPRIPRNGDLGKINGFRNYL